MVAVFRWRYPTLQLETVYVDCLIKMESPKYTKPDRLADVLALIQVLALHGYAHRSESGVKDELQGQPRSSASWKNLAQEHPEFFRVANDDKLSISLVARHVVPGEDGRRLDINFIGKLLEAAIELHDREQTRREKAKHVIPVVVAIIAAAAAVITAILGQ
jgi:hypothetical protein